MNKAVAKTLKNDDNNVNSDNNNNNNNNDNNDNNDYDNSNNDDDNSNDNKNDDNDINMNNNADNDKDDNDCIGNINPIGPDRTYVCQDTAGNCLVFVSHWERKLRNTSELKNKTE